jgi:hypothetical protein
LGVKKLFTGEKRAKLLPQHELASNVITILDDPFGSDSIGNGKSGNVPLELPFAKSSRDYMTRSKGLLPLALHDTGLGISTGN